jgi:hypothetical protein
MEEAFVAAAFAHYNDFGHSVIYVFKTGELVEALGPAVEPFLLLPLARHLCYTTREDLLPEFRQYRPTLDGLYENEIQMPSDIMPEIAYPANTATALEWVRTCSGKYDAVQVYDRLLEALAINLLSFNTSYDAAWDGPVSQNIGWLDFTHGITFSNAARRLCSRYPRFWQPALAQSACFLGRNSGFIDPANSRSAWDIEDKEEFFRDIHRQLFDHGYGEPIFSAHLLKTSMAVADEVRVASPSCRRVLLAALNRFLKSPMKTKHVRRTARQAIRLVGRDFAG